MSDYKDIPVEEAKYISVKYEKPIVIILAYDKIYNCFHTITYGVNAEDKLLYVLKMAITIFNENKIKSAIEEAKKFLGKK